MGSIDFCCLDIFILFSRTSDGVHSRIQENWSRLINLKLFDVSVAFGYSSKRDRLVAVKFLPAPGGGRWEQRCGDCRRCLRCIGRT